MGYSGEANDINFSSGTTAFYGFLGFLINGESTNGAGLSESNVQMPFSPGTISLLWCRVTTAATSSSTVTLRKNSANATNTFSINASAATTDAMNYQVVTGSTGTSMKIAFIAVWGNSAVQVTPVTNYKKIRNVPPMKPPFTPKLEMSNQYTTFG